MLHGGGAFRNGAQVGAKAPKLHGKRLRFGTFRVQLRFALREVLFRRCAEGIFRFLCGEHLLCGGFYGLVCGRKRVFRGVERFIKRCGLLLEHANALLYFGHLQCDLRRIAYGVHGA